MVNITGESPITGAADVQSHEAYGSSRLTMGRRALAENSPGGSVDEMSTDGWMSQGCPPGRAAPAAVGLIPQARYVGRVKSMSLEVV
jgi:hypothetical protein